MLQFDRNRIVFPRASGREILQGTSEGKTKAGQNTKGDILKEL
jgi:hypothetical protein